MTEKQQEKNTQQDKITTQAKSEKSIEQDKTKDKDNKNNVQGNIKEERRRRKRLCKQF